MGELFFDGAVGGHTMIQAPGQIPDLGMQGATHGDVEFLKPSTNAQDRLTPVHAGPDQRQRDAIAASVEVAVGVRGFVTVFFRVHVRSPASQQEPVAGRQDIVQFEALGQRRYYQRHGICGICYGFDVHATGALNPVLIIDEVRVGNDTDDRFSHGETAFVSAITDNDEQTFNHICARAQSRARFLLFKGHVTAIRHRHLTARGAATSP